MTNTDSLSLITIGCILLPIGLFIDNVYIKSPILFVSILINSYAIVKSFKEKNKLK